MQIQLPASTLYSWQLYHVLAYIEGAGFVIVWLEILSQLLWWDVVRCSVRWRVSPGPYDRISKLSLSELWTLIWVLTEYCLIVSLLSYDIDKNIADTGVHGRCFVAMVTLLSFFPTNNNNKNELNDNIIHYNMEKFKITRVSHKSQITSEADFISATRWKLIQFTFTLENIKKISLLFNFLLDVHVRLFDIEPNSPASWSKLLGCTNVNTNIYTVEEEIPRPCYNMLRNWSVLNRFFVSVYNGQ